jgi:hypothetical protein
MPEWNFDISQAPRGAFVVKNRKYGSGRGDTKVFEPDRVILATKCGQVIASRYLPADAERKAGRWEGLATREQPVAWRPYAAVGPQPAHPKHYDAQVPA